MKKNFAHRFQLLFKRFRKAPDGEGIGLIRTLLLSVLVGIFAGLGAILLTALLQLSNWLFMGKIVGVVMESAANEPEPFHLPVATSIFGEMAPYCILFLPALGGLLSGWFVNRFAPEAAGHGTDAAIEAYHFRGGKVRPVAVPVKAVATSILIGTGGSAGCEGPITQIGAGFGSMIANALGLNVSSRRMLMAAGMGAGVGALFHAPLAGAIFAAELLYRDLDLEYEVLVPAIIASVTSHTLFSRVFGFAPLFDTPQNAFGQPQMLLLYIGLAFILAYGARFYTWCFYTAHEQFSRIKLHLAWRCAIGGLVTGIIGFFFIQAVGSGYGTIQDALRYDSSYTIIEHPECFFLLIGVFFLKTLTTSFSVGSGGSGGIFGPSLVVGGALGGAVGMVFSALFPSWDVSVGSFVLVGMVAFFGCAAKTPISTIIMISEMTGNYQLLVPSMWVCIIAYLLSRKVSLYRSQLPNRFEAPVHRSSLVSGTLGAFTAKDILEARPQVKDFATVSNTTQISVLFSRISETTQPIFPVLDKKGVITGIITGSELSTLYNADPTLHELMLVDDLTIQEHPVAFEVEPIRSILGKMDADNADGILVVSASTPRKPIAILTHNDFAYAYQKEIATSR